MDIQVSKYHGCGNDFIMVDAGLLDLLIQMKNELTLLFPSVIVIPESVPMAVSLSNRIR